MNARTGIFALLSVISLAAAAGCGSGGADSTTGGGPQPLGDTSVAAGKGYVDARKCSNCHTSDLSGTTSPLSGYPSTVQLYPPNLTSDTETGLGGWTDVELQNAIRFGVDNQGLQLCPQMKHYATMGDTELAAIINYLRTVPAVKKTIQGSVCPPLKG